MSLFVFGGINILNYDTKGKDVVILCAFTGIWNRFIQDIFLILEIISMSKWMERTWSLYRRLL